MSENSRKERDRQLREDDILSSAQRLFAEKGYHLTTMEEIAKNAEYATGTLYRYFKDKNDLYLSLMTREAERFIDHMVEVLDDCDSSEDKLRMMVFAHFDYYEKHKEFFLLYVNGSGVIDTTLGGRSDRLEPLNIKSQQIVQRTIAEGIARGEFADLDAEMMSYSLAGLLRGAVAGWLAKEKRQRAEVVAEKVFQLCWSGFQNN